MRGPQGGTQPVRGWCFITRNLIRRQRTPPWDNIFPPFTFVTTMDLWRMQNTTARDGVIVSEATAPLTQTISKPPRCLCPPPPYKMTPSPTKLQPPTYPPKKPCLRKFRPP